MSAIGLPRVITQPADVFPMDMFNSGNFQPAWYEFNPNSKHLMDDVNFKAWPYLFDRLLTDIGAMSILVALHDKDTNNESDCVAKRCPIPNIVSYRGFFHHFSTPVDDGLNMGIVLSKADMDLDTFLYKYLDNRKGFPEVQVWSMLVQVARALVLTHEGKGPGANLLAANGENGEWRPIVHRDIKAHNVLVCLADGPLPLLKLADFGGSVFSPEEPARSPSPSTSLLFAQHAAGRNRSAAAASDPSRASAKATAGIQGDDDDGSKGQTKGRKGSKVPPPPPPSYVHVSAQVTINSAAFWIDDPKDEDYSESLIDDPSVSSDTDECSGTEGSDSLMEELRERGNKPGYIRSYGYIDVSHEDGEESYDELDDIMGFAEYDEPDDEDSDEANDDGEGDYQASHGDAMDLDDGADLPDYSDIVESIEHGGPMDVDDRRSVLTAEEEHDGSPGGETLSYSDLMSEGGETVDIDELNYDHNNPRSPCGARKRTASVTSSDMEKLAQAVANLRALKLAREGRERDRGEDRSADQDGQDEPPVEDEEPYFVGMRPPEYPKVGPAGDIWAFGRLGTRLCSGLARTLDSEELHALAKPPSERECFREDSHAREPYMLAHSGALLDLLEQMTHAVPAWRPRAREVLSLAKRGWRAVRGAIDVSAEQLAAMDALVGGDDDDEGFDDGRGYPDDPGARETAASAPPEGNSGPRFARHPIPGVPGFDGGEPEFPTRALNLEAANYFNLLKQQQASGL